MKRKPAIIAYDISKNKKRRQVARLLKYWRLDGQKSVVECYITTAEAEELMLQLSDIADEETDSVLIAWLHDINAVKNMAIAHSSFQKYGMIRVH